MHYCASTRLLFTRNICRILMIIGHDASSNDKFEYCVGWKKWERRTCTRKGCLALGNTCNTETQKRDRTPSNRNQIKIYTEQNMAIKMRHKRRHVTLEALKRCSTDRNMCLYRFLNGCYR